MSVALVNSAKTSSTGSILTAQQRRQCNSAFAGLLSNRLQSVIDAASSTGASASTSIASATTAATSSTTATSDSLKSRLTGMLGLDANGDGTITMNEMVSKAKRDFGTLEQEVDKTLEANGISANPPFSMQLDSSGRITVSGSRSDTKAIEAALNANTNLRDALASVSATTGTIKAAQEAAAFQAAYRENPMEAVNRFRYLFGAKQDYVTKVTVGSDGLDMSIAGQDFDLSSLETT